MADDLTEIQERLQHCREELQRYNRNVMEFANHGFKSRFEQSGPFVTAFATMIKPIPTALRSQAGMLANEIRACLDALACTLAIRNPANKDSKNVYFPLSKSPQIFEDDGMRKIKKLLQADQNKIIALKPYKGGNNILYYLHEADRIRKHTSLVATGGTGGGIGVSGKIDQFIAVNQADKFFENLNEEQQLFSMFMQGGVRINLIFGFRYSDDALRGIRVEFLLEDAINEVDRVVGLFD